MDASIRCSIHRRLNHSGGDMILYNIFTTSQGYRITKWDEDFNVEVSYLVSLHGCECPAQSKPCKHMRMLDFFIKEGLIDQPTFLDEENLMLYDLKVYYGQETRH